MDNLEIVVTANTDGVKKGAQDVTTAVDQIASSAARASSTFAQSGDKIATGMEKVAKKSYMAMYAVQSTGDVIRDIPWAASNPAILTTELTHVIDNFALLKQQTGSTKEALSQIGRSLMGGGGIIIAFNLLATVAGYVAPKLLSLIHFTGDLSEAQKTLNINYQNFNDINEKGDKDAGKQITTLRILYEASTNVGLSMKERLKAVKSLQDQFPDYFKNLTNENILNGNSKIEYDQLTQSIIKTARAKAALGKLGEIASKQLDNDILRQKIMNATANEASRVQERVLKSQTSGSSLTGGGSGEAQTVVITKAEQIKRIEIRRDAALKINDINNKELQNQANFIEKFIGLSDLAKAAEDSKKPKKPKEPKKDRSFEIALAALEDYYKKVQAMRIRDFDANLTDSNKNTTAVNDILLKDEISFQEKKLALIKKYGKAEGQTMKDIALANNKLVQNQLKFTIDQTNTLPKVQNAPGINFGKITSQKIDPKPTFEYSDAIKKNIALQKRQLELMLETRDVLEKTVGPAFDQLFQDILSGSTNAFRSFGKALEQMVVQLGAAILKAALFAAILSAINPFSTGIPGASGFGSIFKSLFHFAGGGKVNGYADGGSIHGAGTSTSDSIPAMLSKGEYVIKASSVSQFGTDFFNTLNRGSLPKFSSGGVVGAPSITSSGSMVFIPSVTLKGQDLLIAFDRANQRRSRNG